MNITFLFLAICVSFSIKASEIKVGTAEVDITPEMPVALMGQFHLRIAETASTPLKANIIAIESIGDGTINDTVVFVSCDLIRITNLIWAQVREQVNSLMPGFNGDKIILNATHTHTGPALQDRDDNPSFSYKIPEKGVTLVKDYRTFLVSQISKGIKSAWDSRTKTSISWGIRRTAIPYNRRVVYKNGTAKMYGNSQSPAFSHIEGYEDHDLQSLFFWDEKNDLKAIAVNVSCPAQVVGGENTLNADYWHPVRQRLQDHFGEDVAVVGWIGAAGDQAPKPVYRQRAIERMQSLSNTNRMEDVAHRVAGAVIKIYSVVSSDQYEDIIVDHTMKRIELPMRRVTLEEYLESKREYEKLADEMQKDPSKTDRFYAKMRWYRDVVHRYENQKNKAFPPYKTEIHIVRLGDIVICTSQFELFTDYGIQLQSRSPALQTFVVELAGPNTYIPTRKAVSAGGYSAEIQSNPVGPEGGDILVAETLTLIHKAWGKDAVKPDFNR